MPQDTNQGGGFTVARLLPLAKSACSSVSRGCVTLTLSLRRAPDVRRSLTRASRPVQSSACTPFTGGRTRPYVSNSLPASLRSALSSVPLRGRLPTTA